MSTDSDMSQHVNAITKAVVSMLPVVGNPLSSLLGDYLPNRRLERLGRFLNALSVELRDINVKLDDDSFGFLVEKAMRVAAADHRQFKQAMLASAVREAVADGGATAVSKARTFIDLIDALEPHHVALLRRLTEEAAADFPSLAAALQTHADVTADVRDDFGVQALSYLCNAGLIKGVDAQDWRLLRVTNSASLWKSGKYAISNLGREFLVHLQAG
jgi:hypothetical protein